MASANPLLLFSTASKCFIFRPYIYQSLDSFTYTDIGTRRFFGGQANIQKTKISNAGKKEAQEALLDYLHSTRGVRFIDAKNISYNSNFFLKQLLDKLVVKEQEVGKSVARFLRYHPFNEFEPFFESLGLHPIEVSRLLPRNLFFLSDDQSLLDNYYTLCDFGIPRKRIGEIYANSTGLFHCDFKTLISKLRAFSKLGFSNQFFPLFLSRTPQILSDKAYHHSIEVINMVKDCGIEMIWVEERLQDCGVFNWSTMLSVLKFLKATGYESKQLGLFIKENSEVLCYSSGLATLSAVCFLCKLGLNPSQISATLNELNKVHVEVFNQNLRRFLNMFTKIGMDADAIGHLFKTHTKLLGSCKIKKPCSLLTLLKVGKKYLCRVILDNPEILRSWAFGHKLTQLERVEEFDEKKKGKMQRENFFVSMGCEKDSPQMKKIQKSFRGKSSELQKRFDFLVEAVGLSHEDVASMVRRYPQVFNMTSDVVHMKIKVFVEELKHPMSELVNSPWILCYGPERVRLRASMYELLKPVRVRKNDLSLCSMLACSEDIFLKRFVRSYPNGHEIWKEMKNKFYSK